MLNFSLSWSGGNQNNPSWEDIQQRLEQAWQRSGTVTLSIQDAPEILAGEIDDLLESGIHGGFNDRIQTSANPP
jgi:hypothetical protein